MTLLAEQEITGPAVWEGVIAEMGPLDSSTHPELRVPDDFLAKIKAKDDNPLFVTVEIKAGMSKSKRRWTMAHLQTVVDKVNGERMTGYLGHPLLKKEDYETSYPPPKVVWAAAKVVNSDTAMFKGYVLKTALDAREDLELGIIDGVSIFGDSSMKPISGGYEITRFDPETIDFARKGRSGMPSRIVALTGEQAPKGGTVEPKDIAALAPDEIKTHAPLVYQAIQTEATAPLTTKIGEMETAATALQPDVELLTKIKEALKLTDGENPVEKIVALLAKIEEFGSSDVKAFIKEIVAKRVKTDRGQALVHRLLGEMHTQYEPEFDSDGEFTADFKKKVTDDVNAKLEGDEDMKELIGEMAPFTESRGRSGGTGGASLGGRSRAGADRGRDDEKRDGIVSQNERLTVRKVRV